MVLSNVPSPMTEDSLDARVEDSGVFVFGFVDGDGENGGRGVIGVEGCSVMLNYQFDWPEGLKR